MNNNLKALMIAAAVCLTFCGSAFARPHRGHGWGHGRRCAPRHHVMRHHHHHRGWHHCRPCPPRVIHHYPRRHVYWHVPPPRVIIHHW